MKKRYLICFLLCLIIPFRALAAPVTSSFSILTDNRIITAVEQSNATDDTYLNCAENIFLPYSIVHVVRMIILLIKIVVPIILIVVGMLDFGKVVLGKPDEQMKKASKAFTSRIVAAVLIYLVVSLVEMVLPMISTQKSVMNCFACVVKDDEKCEYVEITYPEPTPKPTPIATPTPTPRPAITPKPTPSPSPSSAPQAEPDVTADPTEITT